MTYTPRAHFIHALTAILFAAVSIPARAGLDWQVTAYADGKHNAFTDLAFWKGAYYLCFRHATAHMSMDGEIRVMKSADLKTWTLCGTLDTFGDDRDPHFATTDDSLFVYFGVWDLAHDSGTGLPDRGRVRSYVASSTDGERWSKIQGVYEPGFWLWRVRRHDGVFYSAAYTAVRPKPEVRETRLLRSEDGLNWTQMALVTNERMTGEADFCWRPDGQVWLISRANDRNGKAEWFRSDATMRTWSGTTTTALVHSPAIESWKDRVFMAGRGSGEGFETMLWEITDGKLTELMVLPSGGDNAYPGLVADPASLEAGPPAFFISWYSQHETDRNNPEQKDTANIYVGRVVLSK
ncbi:MAG: exo-alpha-sialidase [Candidatus Hydrogenedentes bacterium]|nr:exo-alpha-sialidase [Candidatus Hydrogenedentota bacterium]